MTHTQQVKGSGDLLKTLQRTIEHLEALCLTEFELGQDARTITPLPGGLIRSHVAHRSIRELTTDVFFEHPRALTRPHESVGVAERLMRREPI